MHDLRLGPTSLFKKSARIVGEVLGKYHPHGDIAVYDAMVRMAQNFSMRYPLIESQGNFGSVDGDPPAAMRYTEARLASISGNLISDIQKNTVDFERNFDDSTDEPNVLPASIPNLLVNGATGIAVGMSTNIPPHNLSEVADALIFMLNRWEKIDDISIDNLREFIKGPDFPTGGVIIQDPSQEDMMNAYGRGRGRVTVQARTRVEEMSRGRNRLIVSELPYMTNKSSLIERIAKLAREEQLEGITDLRDESDRQGMRIVIELSKNADPDSVLQELYRRTPMRTTFGIIMLALVNGEPRLLSLKHALRVYLEHRFVVVRRRSEFDLEKARSRAHILEGLRIALNNLNEVIEIIRRARTVETANNNLRRRFKLSVAQAQAILDMPLRRLAALERKKIELEYKEVNTQIKSLQALLRSPKKMRGIIIGELEGVKEAYGDRRRTQIVRLGEGETQASVLTASDLTPEKTIWVSVTPEGLISRTRENKPPRLSGKAAPGWVLRANSRDTLYLVDEHGEAAAIAVHVIPEAARLDQGMPVARITPLSGNIPLASIFSLPAKDQISEGWFVTTVTRGGMVKKSPLGELPGPAAKTFQLVKVNEGDRLGWVAMSDGSADYFMVTAIGMAIRFTENEVRPMGLVAAGVMGIKLKVGDEVIGFDLVQKTGEVYLQRSDGHAKRVRLAQFPKQGRYGQGVIAWKLTKGRRLVGAAIGKGTTRVILHLRLLSAKAVRMDSAPMRTRPARGKSVVEVKAGDQILSIATPMDPPRPKAVAPKTTRKRSK
jgi:DNA gyrase subunit A